MSERTHSPEGTPQGQSVGEFTATATAPETRAVPHAPKSGFSRKQKMIFLAGGTIALAAVAIGLFQFLKQDEAAADVGTAGVQQAAPANGGTRRPLARVGKTTIPWELVAEECMVRHGEEILENIINRTIIFQACQEKGVAVTKEEVDEEVLRISKKFNLTPDNWYAMLQAERNLTPTQYRRDVIWPMLALKKIAGNKVDVTEADLQQAFESAYGERVKAKMIMMDNFKNINDAWLKVRKDPASFEEVAKDSSIEPNSRALGGIIPPIRLHGGNKELEDQAFKMKPGEISAVIQVAAGRFVILKCEGRTEPHVKAMTPEIRQELYTALVEEKTQEEVAKVFSSLKDTVRVDNYLKSIATGGNVQPVSHQTPGTATAGTASTTAPPARNYPQQAGQPRTVAPTPANQQAVRN